MKDKEIYLDSAATTPAYKAVVEEMNRFYLNEYGNPSSAHEIGERAQKAMNEARAKLASEINAKAHEIIFTSGTTESNNLAFLGLIKAKKERKKIVISSIEHSSIFEICQALKELKIVEIPVNKEGLIDIERAKKEIDNNTLLVSIMHVNNEIGTIQNIEKVGSICRAKGAYFHTDCAQSFGKLNIDVKKMNIDLLSAGAHKIGGPKGIGLLYVREGINIVPLIYGGGQEKGLRGGTENIPGIAGFAKALEIAKKIDKEKIRKLSNYFASELEKIGGKINSSKENRIYNIINVNFPVDGENLAAFLSHKKIYVSAGSACDTKKKKESKVLRELGLNEKERKGSIRISLSENISKADIDYVIKEIANAIKNNKIVR